MPMTLPPLKDSSLFHFSCSWSFQADLEVETRPKRDNIVLGFKIAILRMERSHGEIFDSLQMESSSSLLLEFVRLACAVISG
jgi:hypothetical protein